MEEYIIGNVRKIIFESNSGPYKVGLFKVKETNSDELAEYINKVISFTGSFSELNSEVDYIFYGIMTNHPKYGLQFNVNSYEVNVPNDKDSLIMYLSSGVFKGIGVKTAKKIVDTFKEDTINIIKEDYEQLCTIKSINIDKARMIHDKIISSETNQDLIIKLNSIGFSVKESIDLSTMYGLEVLNIIEENIYELKDIISFDKLDVLFLKNNDEKSGIRIKALICHNIYLLCYESGNTIINKEELFIRMKKCFNSSFNSDLFSVYLNELISENEIIQIEDKIALYDFYETEKNILTDINRISSIRSVIDKKKLDKYIKSYEKDNNITFDEEQKEAIKGSIINNFYIITGGPGTGKTTIIKVIVEILKDIIKVNKNDIALLAPTGRSAKRISESVMENASTIHKFLKWNKESKSFGINEYNKAHESIIIVDEASMIDIFLFSSLLKGLRSNCKLLLIGDANQLPSIAPGDVLNDLLSIDGIKSKKLEKIYRVKDGSYISYLASDIKSLKEFTSFSNNYSDFKFIDSSDENILKNLIIICKKVKKMNMSIDSFQVLAPMYKGINGIDNLNECMAKIFNPDGEEFEVGGKKYRIGDKVIQLVNDLDNNVFNGDIGYIHSFEYVDKKIEVIIDYIGNLVRYKSNETDKFNLAYAISIHKAQGSEYDNVVIVLSSSFKRMFYNKLIYTAVTRAKSSLIIIGKIDSFNTSVKTLYANNRLTLLKLNNK